MSVNKFMHHRNIYRKPPDYTDLAIKYPEFRRKCKLNLDGTCSINLKEIENLIALTKVLLKEDFDLTIDIPSDSLVPTVPLRLNYILWIEDIMSTMKIENPKGIDIGCGASCIYSILIAKKNGWRMLALETNEKNFEYAKKNIEINDLHEKIEIFQQPTKNEIFKSYLSTKTSLGTTDDDNDKDEIFDFCLCNPPFFDINYENQNNDVDRSGKRSLPKNISTGKIDELSCEGGEISFVKKIIDESFIYKHQIKIFTTMIGRKCDLNVILKILKEKNITNFIQADFCQGNTTRWGLAWSFNSNLILGLVPPLGFDKTDKQKKIYSCTLDMMISNDENWKDKFIQEIIKNGLLLENLITDKNNQIKLLIKYFESNYKGHSIKKRKIEKNIEVITKVDEIECETEKEFDKFPDLVFLIEAELLNCKLNLKMTYLCGTLGVEGCYKWFCILKNKTW